MPAEEQGLVLQEPRHLPIQVPVELLYAQAELGADAVLVWLNLLMFAKRKQRMTIGCLAGFMNIPVERIEQALVSLVEQGWVNDEGEDICLEVPADGPTWGELPSADDPPMALPISSEQGSDFEWLVNFWSNRVGPAEPETVEKLLYWVDERGVSHEVIAVAVEEMCANTARPNLGYLEGILGNWVNEGVYSYAELIDKPYLAKVLPHSCGQGVHPDAIEKWKELFPDELADWSSARG